MSIDVFDRDFLTQNFDEQAYLDLYGDVATAVADPNDPFTISPDADVDGDGVITGLDHYLTHGFGEGRTAPLLTDPTPTVSFTPSAPQPVYSPDPVPVSDTIAPAPPPITPIDMNVVEGSDLAPRYFNPYQTEVIDQYMNRFSDALQRANLSNNALATSAGAFGGSGHGVATALTNEQAMNTFSDDISQLLQQGFDTANLFGLKDASQYNDMTGLGAQLQMQGASVLPSAAQGQQNMQNTDIQNLLNIGSAQQGLTQQSLDLAYDDFIKQWQYPMDMLGFGAGLASGVPTGTTTIGKTPRDMGGKMSGAGSLLSGGAKLAGKCWVAREVYQDDRWLLFREWLETKAPTWLHDTYCRYGERVADFIKDKPTIKRVIKFFMDKVI
tara:strand:- start:4410 stop:5558 length:1149 start_codon:yes stop_codon:yes gene_type:complete